MCDVWFWYFEWSVIDLVYTYDYCYFVYIFIYLLKTHLFSWVEECHINMLLVLSFINP